MNDEEMIDALMRGAVLRVADSGKVQIQALTIFPRMCPSATARAKSMIARISGNARTV